MPIDDIALGSLVSVVEELQEAIRRNHAKVGSNETRTRNVLIDPLLGALGWGDSSVVTQEYLVRYGAGSADYGVVDYALHPPDQLGRPIAFIEAKRMNEDLAENHRSQVLTYALDKGDSVQYVGLTNGDRWELYEILDDGCRTIFNLSIRDQSALDCAEKFLSSLSFPLLTSPKGQMVPAGPLLPTERGVTASPHAPDVSEIIVDQTYAVDIPKVLGGFGVFLACGGIVGYIIGFVSARPVGGAFAAFGMVVAIIALIAGITFARSFLLARLQQIRGILPSTGLFGTIRGDRRRTRVRVAIAAVSGGIIGGVLGWLIGLQTAQLILDMFAGLGKAVFYLLIALAIGVVAFAFLKGSGRKRKSHPSRWSRRRRRSRWN